MRVFSQKLLLESYPRKGKENSRKFMKNSVKAEARNKKNFARLTELLGDVHRQGPSEFLFPMSLH